MFSQKKTTKNLQDVEIKSDGRFTVKATMLNALLVDLKPASVFTTPAPNIQRHPPADLHNVSFAIKQVTLFITLSAKRRNIIVFLVNKSRIIYTTIISISKY